MVKQTDDARCRLRCFVFRSTLRAFRYDVIMALRSSGHHASAGLEPAQETLVSTYQTRVADYAGMDRAEGDAALTNYAELYGRVQRKLFADVAAGGSAASLKGATCNGTGYRRGCSMPYGCRWKARWHRSESSRSCAWTVSGGASLGQSGKLGKLSSGAGGLRFMRSSAG